MTLRREFEDHLGSMEDAVGMALDAKHADVASQLQCNQALVENLTVDEISEAITSMVLSTFAEKYHGLKTASANDRRLVRALLDRWLAGIYLSQFPDTVKLLVQWFGFKVEAMSRTLGDRDQKILTLRKLLKSADVFDDHRSVLEECRSLACEAAIAASERGDHLQCRALLQLVCASNYVVNFGTQVSEIRQIANDNAPQVQAAAPTL